MDLNRIYYFVTVVECGSYTKAAQRLSIPKSTLSRHIQALEDELKIRLIHRSTRKLSVTKAGDLLFHECLPLVSHLQNAHTQIRDYHQDVTGQLRVTMPTEIGTGFLNTVLPKFMERHPNIQLDIDFSTSNHNLIEEGFDLALRTGNLQDSSYIAKRISTPKVSLYASPDYLLSSGGIHSIDEINRHQNIIVSLSKGLLHIHGRDPIHRQNYRLSTNSMTFNKLMCVEGLGIALLPDILCQEDIKSQKLVKVLPNLPIEQPNIYAIYPSRNHPSKALTTFIDFIAEALSKIKDMN